MKRRILILVVLVAVLSAFSRGQTPDQLFQQANSFFQQGKVAEARDLYEGIRQAGLESGELYFNLGNAYYRTGDIGRAILNYERALRLMPGDEDVRHNLDLANLRIADRLEPVPRLFIWDSWDSIKHWFSLRGITWTLYAVYLVFLGCVAVTLLARTYGLRKMAFLTSLGVLLVLGFFVAVFLGRLTDDTRRDEGVVVESITTVKNSPDSKSSDAFVLHAGVKFQILDGINDWIKIRLADGKVGWMERASAEII
jgi:Tetratricopeptide repeat/Bacterial SH3 domain